MIDEDVIDVVFYLMKVIYFLFVIEVFEFCFDVCIECVFV